MKVFFMIFLTMILISCTQKKTNTNLLSFELRLAYTENKADLKEMVFHNSEQRFFIADSVFFDNSVLVSAEVIDRQSHPKIKVTLNEEGRKKFADFTMNNIGKNAAIIVDGKLVSTPRIMAPITEGILLIVGYFELKEATNIAAGIGLSDFMAQKPGGGLTEVCVCLMTISMNRGSRISSIVTMPCMPDCYPIRLNAHSTSLML